MSQRIELNVLRTTCACDKCKVACIHMPAFLIPDDLPRIAKRLGYTDVKEFANDYLMASSRSWVLSSTNNPTLFEEVPALVMKKVEGGCVCLKDGLCTIHEVSPFGCAFFDMHMEVEEGNKRSLLAARAVQANFKNIGLYSRIHAMLVKKGQIATSKDNREALARAMEAIEASEKT